MSTTNTDNRIGETSFATPTDRELVITRTFDVPRQAVFDAWTKPEHLPHWMLGPPTWTMTVCEIDLRLGGAWHFAWRKNDGAEMGMRGVYKEVSPPDRLVSTESWGAPWPDTLNTLALTEENGRTTMTSTILYPTKEARDAALNAGMKKGLAASFDRLAQHLRTVVDQTSRSTMHIEPYLFFDGRCEEALEFYRRTLGAQVVMMMRFKDSPNPEMNPPGAGDKVMHVTFKIGDSTVLASDGDCKHLQKFQGFALTLKLPNEAQADRTFAALADGGQVQMPMGPTFFARRFGMVGDKFGVSWMIIVEK
jgi:uncharacterized glyoxalase superfamily protein PhnB/uncharacterized protein YndB with AHSA1/START domain